MKMHCGAVLIALAGLLASTTALARGPMNPDGYLQVYVGSDRLRLEASGDSANFNGVDFGFAARGVVGIGSGFLIDAEYGQGKGSKNGVDLKLDRFDLGLGYLGKVGHESSWFVEGVYTHPKFEASFGGSSDSSSKDGIGVKGGFLWPFADAWISKLSLGYNRISDKDGDGEINQGTLEGAIGYKFTPNFGLLAGVRGDSYVFSDNSDDKINFSSVRLIGTYNF